MTPAKFFFLVVFSSISMFTQAQTKAVTETGDEVMLFPNGTWRYVEEVKNNDSIPLSSVQYSKPSDANFLLKSKITNCGVWLNAKKWNFEKSTEPAEYSFSLKENSSFGAMIITEQTGMEINSLRKFALENIQRVASKFNITKEEYRYVNGLKILMLQCEATVQGIDLTYFIYYYTDASSTIQFMGFSPKALHAKYKAAGEELLNGLVLLSDTSQKSDDLQNTAKIQSSLIANSNCKALFKGTWSYVFGGKKYLDKIEQGKMIETNTADDKSSEYIMNWIDPCNYELVLVRSNDPMAELLKMGATMQVEIVEIDDQKMRYQLTYGKTRTGGEMKKEK